MSLPALPIKKSASSLSNYLKYGKKFGKILFGLYTNLSSSDISLAEEILEEYWHEISMEIDGTEQIFCRDVYVPFCISANDSVAHGYDKIRQGDIVSIDLGIKIQDICLDAAFTLQFGPKGSINKWFNAPQEALKEIRTQNPKTTYEISRIIKETAAKHSLNQVVSLAGHGIGKNLHEPPIIHNAPIIESNYTLFDGMAFCAEPVYTLSGGYDPQHWITPVYLDSDELTIKTIGGVPSSHFETTYIVVSEEILDIIGISEWEL